MEQAQRKASIRYHNRVYTALVLMWLLVLQRLHGGAPLESAVLELLRGLPDSFWPRPCKRVRKWREQGKAFSSHTGAYHQARQRLPLSIVQESCDRIFNELMTRLGLLWQRERQWGISAGWIFHALGPQQRAN